MGTHNYHPLYPFLLIFFTFSLSAAYKTPMVDISSTQSNRHWLQATNLVLSVSALKKLDKGVFWTEMLHFSAPLVLG